MSNLRDYIKDDLTLIARFSAIFSTIKTLSSTSTAPLFDGYDNELLGELGERFYYDYFIRPLKIQYEKRLEVLDFSDPSNLDTLLNYLAKVAYFRYGSNWENINKAYFLTPYKPLENYDMEQKRTPNLTNTQTRKQDTNIKGSTSSSVVPFNDTEATLTNESESDTTTTEEKTKNEIENKETGTDTLTRHGNIGVVSSQQMLTQEVELRKLDFQRRIFEDLARVMFRDVFPSCHL